MFFNILFVLILGLIFGSFIGALTFRLPKGISISKGRSYCPKCKKQILWYDNIPLFSYLNLSGKCRNCKKKISVRYPIIEASTSVAFLIIYLKSPNYLYTPFLLILAIIFIIIFVVDFEHQLIPDEFVFAGIFFTILAQIIFDNPNLFQNLLSGLVVSMFLLILHLVTYGQGMGLGDVKLALLIGILLGPMASLIWIMSSFIIGGIFGVIVLTLRLSKLRDKVPFAPFLIAGLLFTVLYYH